jgi:hypothetical protein
MERHRWARARLQMIQSEMDAILEVFPDLRRNAHRESVARGTVRRLYRDRVRDQSVVVRRVTRRSTEWPS